MVSDGPLWGRSEYSTPAFEGSARFQTDPCGVEARFGSQTSPPRPCFRRTLVGSKPREPLGPALQRARFRRTLVGSKQMVLTLMSRVALFQTDPCGVEASPGSRPRRRTSRFQTDPCGVEARETDHEPPVGEGFRRTLVGSKLAAVVDEDVERTRFRRTLVGSKLLPVAPECVVILVSDGPLWGRSVKDEDEDGVDEQFQTDPCGVEASCGRRRVRRRRVSDGPLWGRSSAYHWLRGYVDARFRRTLVGSKLRELRGGMDAHPGFRRTLVGSKPGCESPRRL